MRESTKTEEIVSEVIWDARTLSWRALEPTDPQLPSGLPEQLPPLQRQYSRVQGPEPRLAIYESYLLEKDNALQALKELEGAQAWMHQAPLDLRTIEIDFMQAACMSLTEPSISAESWIEKLRQSAESLEHSFARVIELEARFEQTISKLENLKPVLDLDVSKSGL